MDGTLLILLLPVALIEFGFRVFALVDLWRREGMESSTRWLWTAVIALVNFGWLIYLIVGRQKRKA